MTSSRAAAAAGAVAICVAVTGCVQGAAGQPGAAPGPRAAAASRQAVAARRAPVPGPRQMFGPGCSQLRDRGPDGAAALARLPALTAIGRIPELAEFGRVIRRAGLAGRLGPARSLTIFAPDNAAFTTLGHGVLRALLATPADLRRTVTYQVAPGRVTPAELARHRVLMSLGRTRLYPTGRGAALGANNAMVVCGNVQTASASIYIMDRVVIPYGG